MTRGHDARVSSSLAGGGCCGVSNHRGTTRCHAKRHQKRPVTDEEQVCRRSIILSTSLMVTGLWEPPLSAGTDTAHRLEHAAVAANTVIGLSEGDQKHEIFTSARQGFSFAYPSSFVIAYDRTQDTSRDGAIISIGNFTNTIHTATIFRQNVRGVAPPRTQIDAYDACIKPIIENASTTGFRLLQDTFFTTETNIGVYDYQYEQSICRGEEIVEGVGGVLRCTGVYGQDVPIQKKNIVARSLFLPVSADSTTTVLLTMQASTNDNTMRAIVDSFIPLDKN